MLNKVKKYFENNMESIAMCLAMISGNDFYPFIR